ncbi:hypothetical protein BC938DRAFT_471080 [Jimgerdemannia flammicorona]|uniref:Uncharacterized protein n=1 Tax=Jimgerdemannia flammicorona TaxID=994334 RepID=A0A433Q8V2_9FUNG|nr:hypothetical protein BC938DRAFT_471080 [Jimgerdemannia flammicorona]
MVDSRDTTSLQLDDAKQELSVARKNETSLEARYKKMKGRYDTLNNVHEKLKREFQELMATGEKYKDLAWLKESNEKLRNDVIKVGRASGWKGVEKRRKDY